MDYIHLKDLRALGKHGVSDAERAHAQAFIISLKIAIDTQAAAASDDLSHTIDYGDLRRIALETVANQSCKLIERLAEIIAQKILEDDRVLSAEVSIQKPIWEDSLPGVTIFRQHGE